MIDSHGKSRVLKFVLIQGSLFLIISWDVLQHAQIDSNLRPLSSRGLTDRSERGLSTYIANDAENNKSACILLSSPQYIFPQKSLLGMTFNGKDARATKKLCRATIAIKQKMRNLLRDARIENRRLFDR